MFTARYLDLFTNYISLYNTCMKVRAIGCPREEPGWGVKGSRLPGLTEEGLGLQTPRTEPTWGTGLEQELKPPAPHPPPQVVYIACSFTTVWMIYSKFKATYDGNHDTFRVEFLVVPTAILAFLVNHDFTPLEVGSLVWGGWAVAGRPLTVDSLQGFLVRHLLRRPDRRT